MTTADFVVQTSPLHDIATIPDNAIITSPTECDPCTIPTPLDSPIALSPDPALQLLQCGKFMFNVTDAYLLSQPYTQFHNLTF